MKETACDCAAGRAGDYGQDSPKGELRGILARTAVIGGATQPIARDRCSTGGAPSRTSRPTGWQYARDLGDKHVIIVAFVSQARACSEMCSLCASHDSLVRSEADFAAARSPVALEPAYGTSQSITRP